MRRPAVWRWALVVVLSTGVLVGLLGMHTLTSGHADHSALASPVSYTAHDHGVLVDPDALPGTVAECDDCGQPRDDAMATICVLGLLVSLFLIARPGRLLLAVRRRPSRDRLTVAADPPVAEPPSLRELSISRT